MSHLPIELDTMYKVKINKRRIYTNFSSAFCALIGISILSFLIFCQSPIVNFNEILFWIYLGMFPVFYIVISGVGNLIYRSEKLNIIRVFLLNDFVLYLMMAIMLVLVFVPLEDFFLADYLVLSLLGGFSYLLSLFMYLKLLIA
ncbi:MAG: hypothetical protein EOP47_24420 [Sphingobacteriaceae bacterium]|nr:MAG: hypothetical protein EOP47_24420 [Sphingobacteriaceae bacterium]